ncbi:hypothetical protein HYX12_03610 [Candidatus Woesearchaeota archaeon]|nr:hypothetical protein [Candidatus Woesearchaeota archaeon]
MAEKLPPQAGFDQAKLYVWVKGLESKANSLLREFDLIKNDLVKKNNDLKKEVKSLTDEILEIKREQDKTLEKMDLIIKELKQTAGVEELMVLKKYMELWSPMNFVTQKDLERAVENKLKENFTDN